MRKLRIRTPSPALVISVIALFVAVGGSAYAASQIGTNDIKDKAVKTSKIGSKAVTGGKIANSAVKKGKIKNAAVNAKKLANPIYWGYVSGGTSPVIVRGSGVDSVVREAVGNWKVTFGQSISDCGYVVSSNHIGSGREVTADKDSTSVVSVKVRDSSGALTDSGSAFTIAATC